MRVVILRGVPGSGKSFVATELVNRDNRTVSRFHRVSADDFFMKTGEYRFDPTKLTEAHGECVQRFIDLCRQGVNIVVDNTNLSVAEIAPYYAVAQAYGHDPVIVTVECPAEVAFARQQHGVPRHTFDRMVQAIGNAEFPPWWRRAAVGDFIPETSE